ncbi:MAG: hypothetical protein GY862_05370 [Gammaproteobacteria bacterium]|nr:hypothetical protein [Gammaproteobacteria bacterium]
MNNFRMLWFILLSFLAAIQSVGAATGNIDETAKYAWAENGGWVNFRPAHGGVMVYPDHLEGYAWAENLGWIKLGNYSSDGAHTYSNSGGDWGVNRDAAGGLSGYAWSETAGWVNFSPSHGGVRIAADGAFEGDAWSENAGWIRFKGEAYGVRQQIATAPPPLQPDIRVEPSVLRFDNTAPVRRRVRAKPDLFSGPQALFLEESAVPESYPEDVRVTRVRHAFFNPDALRHVTPGNSTAYAAEVALNLFADISYTGVNAGIKVREDGYSWTGRVAEARFSTVALVMKDGKLTGNINADGEVFWIRPAPDGTHRIQWMNPAAFERGAENLSPLFPETLELPQAVTEIAPARQLRQAVVIIDLLVVYTREAADNSLLGGDIESLIRTTVGEINGIYRNSGIHQELRLVHMAQANYVEPAGDDLKGKSKLAVDLQRLENPLDGYMDEVHQLRERYQADLVSLWVNQGDFDGLANRMREEMDGDSFRHKAFSVMPWYTAPAPGYSFAHELAHNMGAHHDAYTNEIKAREDPIRGELLYPYSQGYIHATGSSMDSWRTIMSYSWFCKHKGYNCIRMPVFSNPDLPYAGVPAGDAATADNRRTLNNTAAIVAGFRDGDCPSAFKTEESQVLTLYNEGNAELTVSSISAGSALGLSVSPGSAVIAPGNLARIIVHVDYAKTELGDSRNSLYIGSNDPDENPSVADVFIHKSPLPECGVSEVTDATFDITSWDIHIVLEASHIEGTLGATLRWVGEGLLFDVVEESLMPGAPRPAGEISFYDTGTNTLYIPMIAVPDGTGNSQLYKAEMQPVFMPLSGVFRFQITDTEPLIVTATE